MRFRLTLLCVILTRLCYSQNPDSQILPAATAATAPTTLNTKSLDRLAKSYSDLNTTVNRQSQNFLLQLQQNEARLKTRLQGKDSVLAQQLFSPATYQQLMSKLQSPVSNPVSSLRNYIPGIDSMQTAIGFLTANKNLPLPQLQKLQALSQQLKQLQGSFQNAADIRDFVLQREGQLSDLGRFGLSSQLLGMNKQTFYYQQQLSQYKNIMNDPSGQQQLVLGLVRQLPAFQSFWQKNSMLSSLLPPSGNAGTLLAGEGLQTGAQVGKMIQQKLGVSREDEGQNAAQFLQQQVGNTQGQMDGLKQKFDQLHLSSGNTTMALPDFSPNDQKHRSFLKRLELGFNLQTTGPTTTLPAISTIGLSLGYKITNNATIGTGLSYLLGLGTAINHTALTSQGVGLRSFLDIRAKGSIWITGGYEYTYMQQFQKISQLSNIDVWQKSALLGLTKKYNIGKRGGNIQLLYDLLASSEIPKGHPLVCRFGYSF